MPMGWREGTQMPEAPDFHFDTFAKFHRGSVASKNQLLGLDLRSMVNFKL